jgi:malate dehydrogenase (oxaloacetate-decarboxylating)
MAPIFSLKYDPQTRQKWLETSLRGKNLLNNSLLNKGTAFTEAERQVFGLLGKLPVRVETLAEQVDRVYEQYQRYDNNLQKNIYLNCLLDRDQTLFYKLVQDHLEEMMPVIYTPIVGIAVKAFSHEYRNPRGLYIAYEDRDRMDEILANRTHPEVDIIVVSDGEGILGIGDQGVGGMDIPVAKLMVYSLCGGIFPGYTLPILLDVGTDNPDLLADPLYLGWRSKRVRGAAYDAFIEQFVSTIQRQMKNVFLHWEDFGRENGPRLLKAYQDKICSFNDDVQGTGAVATAAVLAACRVNRQSLTEQRIVIFGAGTAGVGIANQLVEAFVHLGDSPDAARRRLWLIDRSGLLLNTTTGALDFQKPYQRNAREVASWPLRQLGHIGLIDVVEHIKPTVLIGCSAVAGAFSEAIVAKMMAGIPHQRPVIMPLSNPTERSEATPEDLIVWSQGRALLATGSPFLPVTHRGITYEIAQSNNALVFPGIGLGICAIGAHRLTDRMLWAAVETLSTLSPAIDNPSAPILPRLKDGSMVARAVAQAVAEAAMADGVAPVVDLETLKMKIEAKIWVPAYLPLQYNENC